MQRFLFLVVPVAVLLFFGVSALVIKKEHDLQEKEENKIRQTQELRERVDRAREDVQIHEAKIILKVGKTKQIELRQDALRTVMEMGKPTDFRYYPTATISLFADSRDVDLRSSSCYDKSRHLFTFAAPAALVLYYPRDPTDLSRGERGLLFVENMEDIQELFRGNHDSFLSSVCSAGGQHVGPERNNFRQAPATLFHDSRDHKEILSLLFGRKVIYLCTC